MKTENEKMKDKKNHSTLMDVKLYLYRIADHANFIARGVNQKLIIILIVRKQERKMYIVVNADTLETSNSKEMMMETL